MACKYLMKGCAYFKSYHWYVIYSPENKAEKLLQRIPWNAQLKTPGLCFYPIDRPCFGYSTLVEYNRTLSEYTEIDAKEFFEWYKHALQISNSAG